MDAGEQRRPRGVRRRDRAALEPVDVGRVGGDRAGASCRSRARGGRRDAARRRRPPGGRASATPRSSTTSATARGRRDARADPADAGVRSARPRRHARRGDGDPRLQRPAVAPAAAAGARGEQPVVVRDRLGPRELARRARARVPGPRHPAPVSRRERLAGARRRRPARRRPRRLHVPLVGRPAPPAARDGRAARARRPVLARGRGGARGAGAGARRRGDGAAAAASRAQRDARLGRRSVRCATASRRSCSTTAGARRCAMSLDGCSSGFARRPGARRRGRAGRGPPHRRDGRGRRHGGIRRSRAAGCGGSSRSSRRKRPGRGIAGRAPGLSPAAGAGVRRSP